MKNWIKRLREIHEEEKTFNESFDNLLIILKKGYKIPETFFCSIKPSDFRFENIEAKIKEVQAELTKLLDDKKFYSVRILKKGKMNLSIPQQTYGKPTKRTQVIAQIIEICQNLSNCANKQQKTVETDIPKQFISIAIQEVISAKISGFVYTINPISGKDEVVIETCANKSQSYLYEKDSTLYRWAFKREKCIQRPAIQLQEEKIVALVAKNAQKISRIISSPIALEWTSNGKEIFWLQLDKIEDIRRPVVYSNKISKDLLPGMIKPLVYSINIPVVNSSWKKLFKNLTGSAANKIEINKLARSFYYRTYFNMSVVGDFFEMLGISRDALELLFGREKTDNSRPVFRPDSRILRHIPRMIIFSLRMLFYDKQIETFLRKKSKQFKNLSRLDEGSFSIEDCLKHIDTLIVLAKESSFIVIITQLLYSIYNWALTKNLEKSNIDATMIRYPSSQIDYTLQLSKMNYIFRQLPKKTIELIQKGNYKEIINNPELSVLRNELEGFLKRFGHLSDNANDFSKTTWKENPQLVLKMISNFTSPKRLHPKKTEQIPSQNIASKIFIQKFLISRARKYHQYREQVGFVYNHGYSLFRKFFLRIGENLSNNSTIQSKEDIFYLTHEEIMNIARKASQQKEIIALINKRKNEMKEYQNLKLPETIFDELPENLLTQGESKKNLTGIATSRGSHVGTARVIVGIQDFCKICDGDVLIIPSSDPSWTPLFSKAGAVVSESGGILSHCSIIAREYRIPAVVSVKGALQIKDGIKVAVDGYKGEVNVLKE